MTNKLARLTCIKTLAYAAGAMLGVAAPSTALADELPLVISPLTVVPDRNDLNLSTGKMALPSLTLSVPGSSKLKFDRVQNAAPYIKGVQHRDLDNFDNWGEWSVHTAEGASESFRCVWDIDDKACESVTKSGSYLSYPGTSYRKAGSGELYTLNMTHVFTAPAPNNPDQRLIRQFYASRIEYPDGEVIHYEYGTATLAGDPYARPFYRPIKISSNLGYYITVAYPHNDLSQNGWGTPTEAALYKASDPNSPLAKLTYGTDGTTTDLAGRSYTGFGPGTLGTDVEVNAFSQTLPTEGGASLTATPTTLPGGHQMIAALNRDGVAWNYSYTNPNFDIATANYKFDAVNVTGPNSYHQTYGITRMGNAQTTGIQNMVTSRKDELNRTTRYQYDTTLRLTRVTAPENNFVTVTYDGAGNVTNKTSFDKAGSNPNSEQTFVDLAPYTTGTGFIECTSVKCWRPAWHRDGLNRQTDFVYNSRGQLIEQTDPADQHGVRRVTIHQYAEVDTGRTHTVGTDVISEFISRKVAVRTCGVHPTDATRTTCGVRDETRTEYYYTGITLLPTLERRIDPVTNEVRDTNFEYDAAGRVTSIDGPLAGTGDTQYFRYDVLGRKEWEIGARAPNGLHLAKFYTYRESDDKIVLVQSGTVANPLSPVMTEHERTAMAYDGRRNPIRETRSSNGITRTVTDRSFLDRGLAECTTVRMNLAALPAVGGACTPGTPSGNDQDRITRNVYDSAGQLVQVREGVATVPSIDAAEATYSYTANGKRQFVIDANGNRAQLTYDGHDRQAQWIFPSETRPGAYNDFDQPTALATAGAVNAADYEQYGYDLVGNRTSLRKRDGSTLTYGFDGLNRMVVKVVPQLAGLTAAQTRDVYYDYNLQGLMTKARFDSIAGEGATSDYNGFGELKLSRITLNGLSADLGMGYDPAGKRTTLIHPDGQTFTYARDSLSRATNIYEGTGQTPAAQLIQTSFDHRGLPDLTKRSGTDLGFTADFTFDDIGRLSSTFNDAGGTAADLTISQDYNAASQIWRQTRTNDAYSWTGSVAVNRNYTTNGLNQYTVAGTGSFGYDDNGNLTSDGSATFTYDVENRLVGASGDNTATLVYDPMGRLFQVMGPATNTRFVYDGDELIVEYDANGIMTRRYVHSDNVDDPVVQYDGPAVGAAARTFLMPDERGSIAALIRDNGTLRMINTYDEYGIPSGGGLVNTNEGRFQYTGQAWLPELGMYHYKARIYSPKLGRFLQVDPIGYDGGSALYAYVGNDPVNLSDPTGLAPGDPFGTAKEAAEDAIKFINPTSIKENKEFGGYVQNLNGKFVASKPIHGTGRNVVIPIPGNAKAWYHTHGDYSKADANGEPVRSRKADDAFDSDNFSDEDRGNTRKLGMPGYLGTPSGKIKSILPRKPKASVKKPATGSREDTSDAITSCKGTRIGNMVGSIC